MAQKILSRKHSKKKNRGGKKVKSGKIARHRFRKAAGIKEGFGKPWSAPSIPFRVEFCWADENDDEDNYQVHWIHCRNFKGEERKFLEAHYLVGEDPFGEGETIESKFVCVYASKFLVEQRQKAEGKWQKLFLEKGYELSDIPPINNQENSSDFCLLPSALAVNRLFIFPTTKEGNETIREPIYQVNWTESLDRNCRFGETIEIVFKNSIYHVRPTGVKGKN